MTAPPLSSTARSTVTRLPERARTDRAELHAVLDAALVCHLGVLVGRPGSDAAPIVLPSGYGRVGEVLYLHASTGAGWLRAAAAGAPVCATVTHLDGIVYGRSLFAHSMNYRCAVVHGRARLVTDPDEHETALRAIVEQLSPGSWDHARRPTRRESAATAVLALDLAEASVKVRSGPPGDAAEDVAAGGRWAGVLPVRTGFGEPQPCPRLEPDLAPPPHVRDRAGPA
ncbi:MAG: pyridoxamine 5'-phosphate oxidase family protein [Pseudonocardia sp.]